MTIDVDLVISFRTSRYSSRSKQQTRDEVTRAEDQYKHLIRLLTSTGFSAVGRRGDSLGHILVFISCPEQLLSNLVKTDRDSDFLHGLSVAPITKSTAAASPIAPADRLRLVHAYITSSPLDGGLGINPESKQWNLVESVIVLHDRKFNEQWIHAWTTKRIGVSIGLEQLRQQFGESVALYFAFLDSYTRALVIPAVLGLSFYFFGSPYSPLYSSLLVLWSIGFVEWWRVRERLISVRFGTHGSQKVEKRRVNIDPRERPQWWDRDLRVLSSVPVILAFAAILGLLMTATFVFEAFVTQLYTGPGQKLVSFSPTVLFVVFVPRILAVFQACVRWFTDWEKHVHHSTHNASLTLKTFIFTALVAYLGLALSAFVYVPFGEGVMRIVQIWLHKSTAAAAASSSDGSTTVGGIWNISSEHKLNPGRLRGQMFAYTVTNQIVNTFQEIGLPFILRKVNAFTSKTKKTKSDSSTSTSSSSLKKKVVFEDEKSKGGQAEQELLERVRDQVALPDYDLFGDYSEMVIQFGYVALWSTIWPLAPVMALVNNILELRSDAFKITVHARRPIPVRTDTIGPWIQALSFLSWVGALTNSALVYLFCPREEDACTGKLSMVERVHKQLVDAAFTAAGAKGGSVDSPGDKLWNEGAKVTLELLTTALLVALLASHLWLLVRIVVRHVVERVVWKESKEREEREKEDRRVKEAFLKGLVGDGDATVAQNSEVRDKDMVGESGFWHYEEGVEEIRRILKEA